MQVLFLALGASRKRAVVEESAAVAAAGGRAVVLVGRKQPWASEVFAPGVELLTLADLEARHLPRRLERAVLYQGPRRVAGVVGRGPLGAGARKALTAYEKRVAGRVHRRVFVPLHRRVWPTAAARMILRRCFGPQGGPDLVVVADALSTRTAAEMMDAWAAEGLGTPRLCYSVDSVVPPVVARTAPQTSAAR
ncbi:MULTISPECIES: hypothetical protein [Streptomyces]|uniref:Uncharacterized protein n=2 Tax=Streptomyces TaxID=1883 RepID=A0A117IVV5_9ACTN|nr:MULTISPECIES: hypothetical protein [Streptomyces]KUH37640.1 hypothetical protein ATE80_17250 [Streptomyces kanasensis]UUS31025.1 hypothetical protein NRO40_09360 [Streptomyces changanensis]